MWKEYTDINDKRKKICWEKDDFKIILEGENIEITNESVKQKCSELNFDIANVIVQEWKEIWVYVKDDIEKIEIEKVYFGEENAEQRPKGCWSFTFRNYLGKSFIKVKFKNGQEIKTDPIEIISSKTPINNEEDPLFYPKFLKNLIDEIIEYIISAPFYLGSPTEFPTEEHTQIQSPIFVLHLLTQKADDIIQALQTISQNPYRSLITHERWVLPNEVKSVDEDTIIMMFHHPEYLRKVSSRSILKFLANRLKGYLPERVFERHVIETLDNLENRFIKSFMDIILYWCEEFKKRNFWEKAKSCQSKLEELENYVRYFRSGSLFGDVGNVTFLPYSSQVLLKRDGYRECLSIYRLLNISRLPLFNELKDAIDNRRIDKLYEYWCFFELAKRLAKALGKDLSELKFQIFEAQEGGLASEIKADLGDSYELVYNKTFKRGEESYSINLRPDFTLIKNKREIKAVFDAKFRFDLVREEEIDNELEEEAFKIGDLEKLVKIQDLFKMHTYRDALGCELALVLYPGSENVFYDANNTKEKNKFDLESILNKQGIGAIAMVPENKE